MVNVTNESQNIHIIISTPTQTHIMPASFIAEGIKVSQHTAGYKNLEALWFQFKP